MREMVLAIEATGIESVETGLFDRKLTRSLSPLDKPPVFGKETIKSCSRSGTIGELLPCTISCTIPAQDLLERVESHRICRTGWTRTLEFSTLGGRTRTVRTALRSLKPPDPQGSCGFKSRPGH